MLRLSHPNFDSVEQGLDSAEHRFESNNASTAILVDFLEWSRTVCFQWYCRMRCNLLQSAEAMRENLRVEMLVCCLHVGFYWDGLHLFRIYWKSAGPTLVASVSYCHPAENELRIQEIEEDMPMRMMTVH